MIDVIKEAINFMIADADENIKRLLREHPSRQWIKQREQKFKGYKRLLEDFLAK